MSRYFFRCRACGLPHELGTTVCPITQQAIAAPPPKASNPAIPAVDPPSKPPPPPPAITPAEVGLLPPTPVLAADAEAETLTNLAPGTLVGGRYKILQRLAEGGMGVIYKGTHVELGRPVAVKVLSNKLAHDPAAAQRFRKEARVAGSLGHPNIVEVFDLGTLEDGTPYLVMELLEGETLGKRLEKEPRLPVSLALSLLQQILSALDATHQRGIVHRDLNPENVFLVQRPGLPLVAKVLDFGISKKQRQSRDEDDSYLTLTRIGTVMGTPGYMSPEQLAGERNIDGRSDLYAVGTLAYQMLLGRVPFNKTKVFELIAEMRTPPKAPHVERPEVPEVLSALVLRMLQPQRDLRPTPAEALQQLQGL